MILEGKYIYCIMATDEAKHFGPIGIGNRGDEVHNVCYEGLSAVISNSPLTKYELSQETLLTHQRVVEKVMKSHTVLPVRFCTVAETVEDILRLLQRSRREFLGLLKDMENKVEIGIKVFWKDMEKIFKELVQENPELKKKGREYFSLQKGDRLKLGAEAARFLQQKSIQESDQWMGALARLAHQYKNLPTKGEPMVMNAVYLVENLRQEAFDQRVEALFNRQEGRFDVHYVGPTPPYNFVNLTLNLRNL